MTKQPTNSGAPKIRNLLRLEYVLLGLCLSVMALRCTFTEGPPMQSTTVAANLGDSIYSLSVSAVLIFCSMLWILWNFFGNRFSYRVSGIEIGLGILCAAAVIAGFFAADKRLAITDIAVFIAPPLMALLFIQILDSQQKIRLVLVVIAALGVVSAYQCAEQLFVSNRLTIEQYEQEPETMLAPLGIEPGTLQQFLFEHRLYSKGVRGFFTTRNSAGSFALMALFAAIVLLIEKFKNRKFDPSVRLYFFACAGIAAVIFVSLVLTRSKGALIGLFFSGLAVAFMHRFGNRLKAHRKTVLIVCLLLCMVGIGVIARYGLRHDRLPGGGSMLVRWQYWRASGQMYADHKLTGVGPGNFGHFYPRYKPAAASESVADPHNFPLSILTQYGPLGLIGFLLMILVPLWKMTSFRPAATPSQVRTPRQASQRLCTILLIVVSATLLVIRPMLMSGIPAETFDVLVYLIVTVYVAPVAVFFIASILLVGPLRKEQSAKGDTPDNSSAILLFCAILAVAAHNLIDFAIFEPGVLTAFWAVVACLIATDSHRNPLPNTTLNFNSATSSKFFVAAAACLFSLAYLYYALVPVAGSTIQIRRANRAISAGQFERGHQFLEQAAEADRLSTAALVFNARLYLHRIGLAPGDDRDFLVRAADCLRTATDRNNVAFKSFERLADVYVLLAETSSGREKTDWLDKALDSASEALNRYPACGRLHFKLAQIAEKSEKTGIAREHYGKAIEIEDAYREQFRLMYPDRKEVVSRLGEEMYKDAQQRLKMLSEQPPQ